MDVDSIESCAIKSEVIITETFSFCEQYRDCGDKDLKTEPVDYEECFKCKEEDISVEQTDVHAAPMQQFSCNECDFLTMEKDSLIENLQITKNAQYSCNECNFTTQLQRSVKKHFGNEECSFQTPQCKTPKSGVKYICNECNYTTLIKSYLKAHVKIHKGAEYKCRECDYETVRKNRLKEHVKIHTGEEYKCKECDYKTVWQNCLKTHVKIHRGAEHKCKECDYKTVRKDRLKEHVKIHRGEEHKCKECDYKTVRKDHLKEHVKIHTGGGVKYKCKECDYKTIRKDNLKKHIKIHTGNKYECKECDYKTAWQRSLKEHVKIHTGDEYKCKECDYKTVRKYYLKEHVKIHKGEEYKCKECDYKTMWQSCLKEHVKTHTGGCDDYKCIECDYKTIRKENLKKHIKIHTGDKYECKECDYKTAWQRSLKEHVKIHTGDKYKSNKCDYKTMWQSNLKKHQNSYSSSKTSGGTYFSGKSKDPKPSNSRYRSDDLVEGEGRMPFFPIVKQADNAQYLPRYTAILNRPCEDGVGMEDLDQLQQDMEKLLSTSAVRNRVLKSEIESLDKMEERRKTKKGKPNEKQQPLKRKRPDEKTKYKDGKNGGRLIKSRQNLPKSSFINDLSVESELPKMTLPKNDTSDKFWLSVEVFCADVNKDDVVFLDDLIRECSQDVDIQIPEIGEHYTINWSDDILNDDKGVGNPPRAPKLKNPFSNELKKNGLNAMVDTFSSPLTQRLLAALIEENVVTSPTLTDKLKPSDFCLMKTRNGPKNDTCMDRRLRKELVEQGIFDVEDLPKSIPPDDEILLEIKKCMQELKTVNEKNVTELTKLRKIVAKDLRRQEVKEALEKVDNDAIDIYNRMLVAKQKQNPQLDLFGKLNTKQNIGAEYEEEANKLIQQQVRLHKELTELTNATMLF
ncbi:hypothetical protein FQA39_LY14600 [Lamprigera yunnana]|nr:hypothetical protein FQA39_LY14600 [Lamprigera yunnana]